MSYRSLPKLPGVYWFQNSRGKIIYIGKARNLYNRVRSYFHPPSDGLLAKTAALVAQIEKINHIEAASEVDALILEANLIKKFQPKYNFLGKDGKSFPFLEITRGAIPRVRLVHRRAGKNIYLGPYPPGSDISGLLRYLRRIFPYVSSPHRPGGKCLLSHLGLCPCPDYAGYKTNLRHLRAFLTGKRQSVQRQLEKEMLSLAKRQNFEEAQKIKRKLEQIVYITSAQYQPWQYEQNPNLIADRANEEITQLRELLNLKKLDKIECFDISNTAGKNATGGQAVFRNGQPEKKLYRRYRIKFNPPIGGSDDYAMLAEVLSRRLKSPILLPDLFVIDGGKGQLAAARAVIPSAAEGSPKIIALAKRLETIYTDDGKEIQLPPNSPALHLLQRLRDEAHRFSRKYHFLLRRKNMIA